MIYVKIGKVISVEDDMCAGRIKVALGKEDNDVFTGTFDESVENLQYCLPLLPKMLHVMPKEQELVYILSDDDSSSRRYYIGPIISQPEKINFEEQLSAEAPMPGGTKTLDKSVSTNGVNSSDVPHAVIPSTGDIAIEGRKNSGIKIGENDLCLKSGVKIVNSDGKGSISFNNDNTQSYFLLKYNESGNTPSNSSEFKSAATIVADKINLLGNRPSDNGNQPFELCDPDELITFETLLEITNNAQKVPLGNDLVQFLLLLTKCVLNHTHPISLLSPTINNTELEELEKYTKYDSSVGNLKIYGILSKNVSIN